MSKRPTKKNAQIEDDAAQIESAANAASLDADSATIEERLDAVEGRLAETEGLFEQAQANATLGTKLSDYVDDLRAEQSFYNNARIGVGCVACVALLLLLTILALSIFHPSSPLLKPETSTIAVATFIVGLTSGIVFLINGFVKGLLRSTVDRHSDGFLPPQLQEAAEMLQKIVGPSKD